MCEREVEKRKRQRGMSMTGLVWAEICGGESGSGDSIINVTLIIHIVYNHGTTIFHFFLFVITFEPIIT